MNNMNPLYQEAIVLQKEKELEAELEQIQLHKKAAQATANGGWLDHRIAHLAEWMIATGESLSQRYDHTAMHSYETRNGAMAH